MAAAMYVYMDWLTHEPACSWVLVLLPPIACSRHPVGLSSSTRHAAVLSALQLSPSVSIPFFFLLLPFWSKGGIRQAKATGGWSGVPSPDPPLTSRRGKIFVHIPVSKGETRKTRKG
ncbi:uncharacterized protein MCYG_08383 [Microsporum canis CBS 113480]|uniref:Uncharacterized protein n=1 Tax=Arthroderma otae (strain ATCC MYA-4605 / CBS 113480) TaxID=554155 RepID=C5G0B1_ARTOC|nr:uncharacterized protein MCYG_08383 [Microsporum canis CBS 113480]EEQ35564.1 predicted protein [Microsporum canis CBS 113480]